MEVTADPLPSSTWVFFFSFLSLQFISFHFNGSRPTGDAVNILVSLMAMKNKCDDADWNDQGKKKYRGDFVRRMKCKAGGWCGAWRDVAIVGYNVLPAITIFVLSLPVDKILRLVFERQESNIIIYNFSERRIRCIWTILLAPFFYWNFSWHRQCDPFGWIKMANRKKKEIL